MEVSPALVLSMWSAGLAAASGVVARWRVVGPGFVWLVGGVTLLLGVPAALTSGRPLAWAGVGATTLLIASARRWALAVGAGVLAAVCFGVVAGLEGPVVGALSGALFLGAVTSEMMLGHWYLVDPRMPRWALRRLAWAGAVAAVGDFLVLIVLGVFPWATGDTAAGIGFVALAFTSALLMLAVIGALREEGYSGVMAATGLSYLALLTSIGAVVIGRLVPIHSIFATLWIGWNRNCSLTRECCKRSVMAQPQT